MLINGFVYVQDLKHVDGLIESVNRVGRNINQITRHTNQIAGITKDEKDDLKKRMSDIWLLLKSGLFGEQ